MTNIPGAEGDPASSCWIIGRDYGDTERRLQLPFQGLAGNRLNARLGFVPKRYYELRLMVFNQCLKCPSTIAGRPQSVPTPIIIRRLRCHNVVDEARGALYPRLAEPSVQAAPSEPLKGKAKTALCIAVISSYYPEVGVWVAFGARNVSHLLSYVLTTNRISSC